MNDQQEWFENTWEYRDNVLYPALLGAKSDGLIFKVPYEAFARCGVEAVDPRWLHCGILRFDRSHDVGSVTYITSGLSNAWNDDEPSPDGPSGLGIELRIDNTIDAYWSKDVLLRLAAMQLVIHAGLFPGAQILSHGDLIVVGSESLASSSMTGLIAFASEALHLPSGHCQIMQLFAVTDAEQQFASEHGADELLTRLRRSTLYPINNPERASTV